MRMERRDGARKQHIDPECEQQQRGRQLEQVASLCCSVVFPSGAAQHRRTFALHSRMNESNDSPSSLQVHSERMRKGKKKEREKRGRERAKTWAAILANATGKSKHLRAGSVDRVKDRRMAFSAFCLV